jgi:NADPH:quinone reductase-like Zn-dependent oxidoreductase
MKAAVLHAYDASPRHGQLAEPEANEAHAVVEVAAAGVNHVDLLNASGRFYTGPPPLQFKTAMTGALSSTRWGTVAGRPCPRAARRT